MSTVNSGWLTRVLAEPLMYRPLAETWRSDPSISPEKQGSLAIREEIEAMIVLAVQEGPDIDELIETAPRDERERL